MKTKEPRKTTPEIQFQHMNSGHILYLTFLAFYRGRKKNQALTQCSSSCLRLLLGEPEGYEINSVSILPGRKKKELILRINRKRDLLLPKIHSRTRASKWLQSFLKNKPYKENSSNVPPVSVYFAMEENAMEQKTTVRHNEKRVAQLEALEPHEQWMAQPETRGSRQKRIEVAAPLHSTVSRGQLLKVLEAYLATTTLKEQRQPVIEYYLRLNKPQKRAYLEHPVGHWPDSAWFGFFQVLQKRLGETWSLSFLRVQDDPGARIAPVYEMSSSIIKENQKCSDIYMVFYPEVQTNGFLEYKVFISKERYKTEDRKLLQDYALKKGEVLLLPPSRKSKYIDKSGEKELTGIFCRSHRNGSIKMAATVSHLKKLFRMLEAACSPHLVPSLGETNAHLYRNFFQQVFGNKSPEREYGRSYATSLIRLCLEVPQDYAIHSVRILRSKEDDLDIWMRVNEEMVLVFFTEIHRLQWRILMDKLKRRHRAHKLIPVYYEIADSSNFVEMYMPEIKMINRQQVLPLLKEYLSTTPPAAREPLLVNHYKELLRLEKEVNSHRVLPIAEWNYHSWNGLFRDLQLELGGYWEAYDREISSWMSEPNSIRFYKGQRLIKHMRFYLNLKSNGQNCLYLQPTSLEDWENFTVLLWQHLEKQEQRLGAIPFPVDRGDFGQVVIPADIREDNGIGLLDMEETLASLWDWLDFLETVKLSISADFKNDFTVIVDEELFQLN